MPGGADFAWLAAIVFASALLYSSGGHAGASAYLAAMALWSVAPEVMKPTALVLNLAVATIGSARFAHARAVPWEVVRPLVFGSMPAAFAGGAIRLSPGVYLAVLGAALLVAALFLWLRPRAARSRPVPRWPWLVVLGAALGFLAGLTGIGGGVFLTPLLILTGWQEPRRTAGAAAVFILANSALGLLGHASSARLVPDAVVWLVAAAVGGGLVGSWIGAHRLPPLALRRVHSVLLVVSGGKLLLEALRP